MSDSLNIGIVGAGIMGRMLAWRLVEQGHQVSLFDKDPIEHGAAAAYTAAGMLTPFAEIESAELLIFQMGMRSLQLWPEWIKSLDADVGFHQSGSLIVSHAQDKSDLIRFNQQLNYKLNHEKSLGEFFNSESVKPQQVNQNDLADLEPELAGRFSEATYLPDEAWLCTQSTMNALAEKLKSSNVKWFANCFVDELSEKTIQATQQKFSFDRVIDCRGLGAKKDVSGLRGVRGEVILLEAPDVKLSHLVRLMHPRYRLYIVPKMRDNLFYIGATQIESDDVGPITVRSALELLSAAYSLHSGFAEARILQTKTNCRPALSDNLPQVRIRDGVVQVNGLYRHGFLLAPTVADEVSRWITQGQNFVPSFKTLFQFELAEEKVA